MLFRPLQLALIGLITGVTPYQMFAPAYMKLGDIKGEVVGLNSVQITKLSKKSG